MLHRAVEHVGDGLEPAVRVVGRALRLARAEIHRAHLVEEQERVDLRQAGRRERPAHLEPAALELTHRGDDRLDRGGAGLAHQISSVGLVPFNPLQQRRDSRSGASDVRSDPMDAVALLRHGADRRPRLLAPARGPVAVLRSRRALRRCRSRRVRRGARAGHRPAARLGHRAVPLLRATAGDLDIRINEVVRGHQISQARAVGIVDGDEILTVNAALGDRDIALLRGVGRDARMCPRRWTARPAQVMDRHEGTIMDRIEMRLADARTLRRARRHAGQRAQRALGPPARTCSMMSGRVPGDRRRLRAVRDLAGARPPRRRQQPRQHPAGREPRPRPTGSSPTSACTRSPTASATASCTSGPRTARLLGTASQSTIVRNWREDPERMSQPRHQPTQEGSTRDDSHATLGHHRPVRRRPAHASTRRGSRSSSDLGFTDVWSSEANAHDAFTPARARRGVGTVAPARSGDRARLHPRSGAARAVDRQPRRGSRRGGSRSGSASSSNVIVERWNGIPFEQSVPARPRHVRFLRAALTGEKVTAEYETFDGEGLPARRPAGPSSRRSSSPRCATGMLQLAGREGDGAIINWLSADDVQHRRADRARSGRTKEIAARIFVLPERGPRRGAARSAGA